MSADSRYSDLAHISMNEDEHRGKRTPGYLPSQITQSYGVANACT